MAAQMDKTFYSTVYCWRESERQVVKANFFSVASMNEKFLYNIDTNVTEVGDDLSRGFNFIGAGEFAILPETRLKIDVNAFFEGKLKAFALKRPETVVRMNVVNAKDGDKDIRLCSVLTFDESAKVVNFGGQEYDVKPRLQKPKKTSKTDVKVKSKEQSAEKRNDWKSASKSMKAKIKPESVSQAVKQNGPKAATSSEPVANPSLEELNFKAKGVDSNNDKSDSGEDEAISKLSDLMASSKIVETPSSEANSDDDVLHIVNKVYYKIKCPVEFLERRWAVAGRPTVATIHIEYV